MSPNTRQGLVKKRGLTDEDLTEVQRFTAVCNQHEGLDLSFNLETAGSQAGEGPHQFLHYANGELAGLLSLQVGREIEVCLAVHPAHRRNGVGRSLLDAAREECRARGASSVLLVCEEGSRSGKAFVDAVGAQYRFSEYRMKLEADAMPGPLPSQGPVQFARADAGDVEVLARMIATSFGRSAEEERQRVARDLEKPTHRFFVARVNEEPVGSLGVAAHGQRVYIIAFNVLPGYRGRGYGRQMLAQTVETLLTERWDEILLEVETENRNALSLYRSCGFEEITSYGYYQIKVS